MINKVLLLVSGGLDSSVMLAHYMKLDYEVHILYIDYGQANKEMELSKLKRLCSRLGFSNEYFHSASVSLEWCKGSCLSGDCTGNPYIEMRNLIFISTALSLCESQNIDLLALGYIFTEEDYLDTSAQFITDIRNLAINTLGVRIEFPFYNLSKYQVYEIGKLLGISISDTFSCNTPVDGEPCGKCGDCRDIEIVKQLMNSKSPRNIDSATPSLNSPKE